MPLDEKDKAELQGFLAQLLKPVTEQLGQQAQVIQGLQAKVVEAEKAKAEPAKGEAEKAGAVKVEKAGAVDHSAELAQLQGQLREAAFLRHLPEQIDPSRAALALKVLSADGRLVTREGVHYIALERNGLRQELPLEVGLKEWAGTKEADIFAKAPPAGSGAGPTGTPPAVNLGRKLAPSEAAGAILDEILKQ